MDPETNDRLKSVVGKVVNIQFKTFGYQAYFLITESGIRILDHYDGQVDVTLSGAPFDFLRLSFTSQRSTDLLENDIKISGDMDVAKQFQNIFAELDVDWEEQLSHITGDVIAHQVGKFVRALSGWAKKTSNTMQQNLTEYVQEEVRWLPSRLEVQDFLNEIDQTRHDTERLEAKMQHLTQRIGDHDPA
jgi:ubiquinone biosynthesis protein UbiJ